MVHREVEDALHHPVDPHSRGGRLSSPSLRKNSNRFEISVARMVDDTVTLLELLRGRFGGKTFEAAQRFHDSLTAPSKRLVWFEGSAHPPHLEEPAKFRDLLMNVRASQLART